MELKKNETIELLEQFSREDLIAEAREGIRLCVIDFIVATDNHFDAGMIKDIIDTVADEAYERTLVLMEQSIENDK